MGVFKKQSEKTYQVKNEEECFMIEDVIKACEESIMTFNEVTPRCTDLNGDMISTRIAEFNNYAIDSLGNINIDHKLNQFTTNLINNQTLEPAENENYIDYNIRINKLPYKTIPESSNISCNYVSSIIDRKKIEDWIPGSNVFAED